MHPDLIAGPDTAAPVADRAGRFALNREKALALFASKGFAQVGMRELATQMGVSPGALYHHYPSKQHLLFDFVEEFYEELLEAMQIADVQSGDRVGAVIDAHLDLYARLHWHFSIAMRDGDSLTPELQQEVAALKARYHEKLSALLDFRRIDCCDEVQAVTRAIAALLNATPAWVNESALQAPARRALLENLLRGAIERLLSHGAVAVTF
ncbi:TetR/AcrR family transcriptional regulator [Pseudomonas sp. NPDC090202]|uniref:TetR/AcrR family transcriptional regulator n=1 Tax=unclassified Pseudomonas TaxID=196821 RepID=UPI003828DAB0